MINLLSNAFKFTFKGSIQINAENLDAEYIKISVIDSGKGMQTEQLSNLF